MRDSERYVHDVMVAENERVNEDAACPWVRVKFPHEMLHLLNRNKIMYAQSRLGYVTVPPGPDEDVVKYIASRWQVQLQVPFRRLARKVKWWSRPIRKSWIFWFLTSSQSFTDRFWLIEANYKVHQAVKKNPLLFPVLVKWEFEAKYVFEKDGKQGVQETLIYEFENYLKGGGAVMRGWRGQDE
ncbi:MAG TPA: hypothetical protein ENI27_01655 [bacterium]|nr:hypothetical protein [bacterium]